MSPNVHEGATKELTMRRSDPDRNMRARRLRAARRCVALSGLALGLCIWVGSAGATPADLSHLALGSTLKWSTLDNPDYVTSAHDGSGRLFVVEKTGRIRVIRGGVLENDPYLDISSQVTVSSERGLLGMAFSPGFANNGRFYIDYIDLSGNTVVARYVVSDPTSDTPSILSSQTILYVPQPTAIHKGGCLQFGPDGYLYVGLGDGGPAGDSANRAQNRRRLLGKILRIDTGDRPGTAPFAGTYRIPGTNPYARNKSGWRKEIWEYGLRNPWRFSFDSASRNLWIGDVGQDKFEEIDFQLKGRGGSNFGWHVWEGNHRYTKHPPAVSRKGYTFPILEYRHPTGEAVIGGYVYRGSAYPALYGTYVYGDLTGWIGGIRRYSAKGKLLKKPQHATLLTTSSSISSFGVDDAGELYYCDVLGGRVYQITATTK